MLLYQNQLGDYNEIAFMSDGLLDGLHCVGENSRKFFEQFQAGQVPYVMRTKTNALWVTVSMERVRTWMGTTIVTVMRIIQVQQNLLYS